MADNSSLYGSTPPQGTVSSSNYTTLYTGGNNYVPSGDNVIISGTLTVNGCAILTDCSAFSLLPANATTINFGNSATAMSIGGASGVTTIQNQLATGNYLFPLADGSNTQVLATDGAGVLYWANNNDFNTTYTINSTAGTGGANFNLVGSDATTDTILFAQGSGISVVRTDANTITITNTDPGSAGVTSITGTANQVIASASTGAVTLSTPQDIATTSSPTFAGLTAGNVTVGLSNNNTIETTSGDLLLDSASGTIQMDGIVNILGDYLNLNSDNSAVDSAMRFNASAEILYNYANSRFDISKGISVDNGVLFVDATNNRVGINNTSPLYELHIDQGLDGLTQLAMTTTERTALLTMNDGDDLLSLSYGPTFADNRLQFSPTDQWFNLGKLGVNTAAPAYTLDVNGTGNFQGVITGGLKINGSTNGFSNFIAPPTGSDLYYSLPATAGAANTVLTNDGVGNLSWALPGGGGSTFGNITIAVDTDNTISTTTGDLVLDSSSGTIAMNVPTITTDATTLDLFNTTTTTLNIGGAATTVNLGNVSSTSSTVKLPIVQLYNNTSQIDGGTITTTSTTPFAIAGTTRQSMKVIVNVIDNVTTEVHSVEAFLMKKGTTAYLTTYAEMYSAAALATFSTAVNAGVLELLVTPISSNSTTTRMIKQSLT